MSKYPEDSQCYDPGEKVWRHLFAGWAMKGILSSYETIHAQGIAAAKEGVSIEKHIAKSSVEFADELLKQLNE